MSRVPPLSWRASKRRLGTFEADLERRRAKRMGISTAKRVIGRPDKPRGKGWHAEKRRLPGKKR